MAEEAPDLWAEADRFIEAGDWLVWQLSGQERRSSAFATFKAQYRADAGYPCGLVPGLGPLLMQVMADVLGREVQVPQKEHLTAVGAAVHGAVAAGVVQDYAEGARRYGAVDHRVYRPDSGSAGAYAVLYEVYRTLGSDGSNRAALHALAALKPR